MVDAPHRGPEDPLLHGSQPALTPRRLQGCVLDAAQVELAGAEQRQLVDFDEG